MGSLPDAFMFSQSNLQDYVDCPRRFELKHLLHQRYPAPVVDDMLLFEARLQQGEAFHHVVHQHLIGIPSDKLISLIDDPLVVRWFNHYLSRALLPDNSRLYPEKTLTIPFGEFGLLAKIDVLAFGDPIQIVDWKTTRSLPRRDDLAQRLQTIVYPYVLVMGGGYLNQEQDIVPDQVEMIYYYVEQETPIVFEYSQEQLERDRAYLQALIAEIDAQTHFELTEDVWRCRFCTYRSLCDRGQKAGSVNDWETDEGLYELDTLDIDIEQIAEIEF